MLDSSEYKYLHEIEFGKYTEANEENCSHVLIPKDQFHQLVNEYEKTINDLKLKNQIIIEQYRERANKERKLQPKKEHSGYVIKRTNENHFNFDGKGYRCFETEFQSPYNLDFDWETTYNYICRDICKYMGCLGFQKLDLNDKINDYYGKSSNEYGAKIINDNKPNPYSLGDIEVECDLNIIYEMQLIADYFKGYWNFKIKHTKPLNKIPSDFLKLNKTK